MKEIHQSMGKPSIQPNQQSFMGKVKKGKVTIMLIASVWSIAP
jgi:hypothetical protein